MRISRAPLEIFFLCLLAPALQLPAQSIILPKISFTGAPAYSQTDLLAVSGLKPGATSTPAAIQAAAQRISDTGLIFHLKPMPAENVLPAQSTNFIWWKPAELTAALHARVPLFIGAVPPDG